MYGYFYPASFQKETGSYWSSLSGGFEDRSQVQAPGYPWRTKRQLKENSRNFALKRPHCFLYGELGIHEIKGDRDI